MPKSRTSAKAAARPRPVASRLVPTKPRHDGWTPERQTGFLDALAACGCVTEACAAVGMSTHSAYRLRMRPDAQGFRVAWDGAIDLGIRRLSDACLSRAIHGEAVPHYYKGEVVGEHRRYDNRLATFLLRYRDPLRYAASLDQMVYSGHPEAAAVAYTKARHRAADEAWGVADEPAAEIAPPFERRTIAEATAEAVEEAEVAGDGPVGGTTERRNRILAKRRERAGDDWWERNGPPTLEDVEAAKFFPGWLELKEESWRRALNDLPPHEREQRRAEAVRRPDFVTVHLAPDNRFFPSVGAEVGGDVASPSPPLAAAADAPAPPSRPRSGPRVRTL